MTESKARILIVDDDPHIRESLLDVLEDAGYAVSTASSEKEALVNVHAHNFDVILMDYNLPDSTGIQVIKKIKKIRPIDSQSQILMLTADKSQETAVMAIQESVADFLVKPVDVDRLKRVISNSLEKLRLMRENERITLQLKKSNEELEHLDRMKSKFLSMSSHDLSNALMALQASFELLSQTINPSEEQKKRMLAISSSISQLTRLTADLVDWASIENGKFRIEREVCAPAALLREILLGSQARAQARGIKFTEKIEKSLPDIYADKRRISQVLNNLLENAIRYTSKGGEIMVYAMKIANGNSEVAIQFGVKDSGDGIPPSELGKIFQSFYQGSDSSKSGRLGLGLATSKEIVEAHGGRIWVESEGVGRGATFFFTVPASKKP